MLQSGLVRQVPALCSQKKKSKHEAGFLACDLSLVFRHWNMVDVDFSEELLDLQVHEFFLFWGEKS